MINFDVVIIGGGAAGMLAAISARRRHPDWKIVLLEKNQTLGRKILATGNGRCNLTNINLSAKHFNNPQFVEAIFKRFGLKEIINFFTDLGLLLYEEKKSNAGKIFPVSDSASSVVNLLSDAVKKNKVEVYTEVVCESVTQENGDFLVKLKGGKKLKASRLILAAGGKTYPALGADGSGFDLAEQMGHKIVPPVPSGVSLEGKNILAQELQGLKLSAEINLPNKEKFVGDLMFTKYGLSGTAALSVSRPLSIWLNRDNKKEIILLLNFMPGYTEETATKFWLERKRRYPKRIIELDWCGVFSPKFANVFLRIVGISGEYSKIDDYDIKKLAKILTHYEWKIIATRGWNEAEFTAGGVDCNEIDNYTLESKKINGLYFAGEVIDVDGEIGGYNLSWAWSSGFIAGQAN